MWDLGLLVVLTPLMQFLLIKLRSPWIFYFMLPLFLCVIGPFYLKKSVSQSFATAVCFLLFNSLRITDIALLPHKVIRSWTISDYYEYFVVYYTKPQRQKLGAKCYSKYAVPFSERNASYYGKLAWKLTVQYGFLHILVWYSYNHPFSQTRPDNTFLKSLDLKIMMDNFVFGLLLCVMLSISKLIFLRIQITT